jgi:hypothetical protein
MRRLPSHSPDSSLSRPRPQPGPDLPKWLSAHLQSQQQPPDCQCSRLALQMPAPPARPPSPTPHVTIVTLPACAHLQPNTVTDHTCAHRSLGRITGRQDGQCTRVTWVNRKRKQNRKFTNWPRGHACVNGQGKRTVNER